MLDFKAASTTATSIVHSKLDYFNSNFLNLESTQLNRLQLIQNLLARTVIRTPRHRHITPIPKSLHWQKFLNESISKLCRSHTIRCNNPSPRMPSQTFHHPANPLYPILLQSNPLSTPVTARLKFHNRGKSISSLRLWNDLLPEFRTFSVLSPSLRVIHRHPL